MDIFVEECLKGMIEFGLEDRYDYIIDARSGSLLLFPWKVSFTIGSRLKKWYKKVTSSICNDANFWRVKVIQGLHNETMQKR